MAEPQYQWTIRLPIPLGAWVEEEARRRDVPRSQVLIEAVEAARQQSESKGR